MKHVFIYAQREKNNDMTENPYIFDTFKLNAANDNSSIATCHLEYGNAYESDSKSRIFSDLMNFSRKKNDYNTGTQLNIANFTSLYPLIYFDLTYGEEKPTRDPKKLNLKFTVNQAAAADFRLHAIVLCEEDIVVNKMGDELVIL